MELFELGRVLHSGAGVIALVTFWVAAVASKGGRIHRRAGKIYLVALLGVLSLSTLMVAGKALQGDLSRAIFLAFLISLVGTASWLTWFSIRFRRDPERLVGPLYRTLASWLVLAGAAMFWLGVTRGVPLIMLLSLLGVGFGANMWRLALVPARDGRWWLAHHMNGAALNFMATHDSFLALAIGSVVPELRQPVPRMIIGAGVIAAGIAFRVWFARRQRRVRQRPEGVLDRLEPARVE